MVLVGLWSPTQCLVSARRRRLQYDRFVYGFVCKLTDLMKIENQSQELIRSPVGTQYFFRLRDFCIPKAPGWLIEDTAHLTPE